MRRSDEIIHESVDYSALSTLSGKNFVADHIITTICVPKKHYLFIKRFLDIVLSVTAIIFLAPLFLFVAAAIKLDSKGSAIHTQLRVTKDGQVFKMYKFRSMCENADEYLKKLQHLNEKNGPVFKIINDPRVTRVGRIIRKTSIDELPQLLNIIKGEMTIVGPRPPLVTEVEQYTEHQKQRLNVKTGLTCYWQISGRSELTFDEWVKLDMKYIQERNLRTDINIIVKTIPAVLLGRGAY